MAAAAASELSLNDHPVDDFSANEMVCLESEHMVDQWKCHFDKYDILGKGEISKQDFQELMVDPQFQEEIPSYKLDALGSKISTMDHQTLSYQEFINIMSNKRNPSFRLAVQSREGIEGWNDNFVYLQSRKETRFRRMVRKVAKEFLTDELDRQYYSDRYSCWPPPLFLPVVTLMEIGCFIYHCIDAQDITPNGPVPLESLFIYRPDKRLEMWRFLFYMLIHAGWVHLFFNMIVQVMVGIPLEMVHGSFRIGAVYIAGVLAGSLGTSVFDMDVFLVGASGGVYALLAAHLANILLNYPQMELGIFKLGAIFIVASADVGFAIWDRYSSDDSLPPVGYTAHLMGALAGLTIGLVVLKNFEQKLHEQYIWWLALGVYLGCSVFAVFWNIFYY